MKIDKKLVIVAFLVLVVALGAVMIVTRGKYENKKDRGRRS